MKIEPEIANVAIRTSRLQDQERSTPLESVHRLNLAEDAGSPAKLEGARSSAKSDDAARVDKKILSEAVNTINSYAEIKKVDLLLHIDDQLKEMVISVVDRQTDEIIRQIPSEHAIDLAKKIDAMMNDFFSSDHSINLFNDEA